MPINGPIKVTDVVEEEMGFIPRVVREEPLLLGMAQLVKAQLVTNKLVSMSIRGTLDFYKVST